MAARVALLLVIAATSLSSSAARRRGVSAAATAMASPSVRASAQTPPPEPAYEAAGPCTAGPTVVRGSLRTTNTGERLSMTLTLPGGASDDGRRAPPWPVVAFFNGFQARASFYRPYATHLASWGFATLQYDVRPLAMPPDAVELAWLADAVAWAKAAAPASDPLSDTLFCAGHSRGGKLAALHAAGAGRALDAYAQALASAEAAEGGGGGGDRGRRVGQNTTSTTAPPPPPIPLPPPVAGAFLLDAIDNTRFAPESPAYPSAARALGGRVPVGCAAAGVVGACNPAESSTLATLWPAAGPGSWLALLPGAGHAEFLDAGALLNRVFDALCGRGDGDGSAGHGRAVTIRRAAAALVAWVDGLARGGGVFPPLLPTPPPAEPADPVSVALRFDRDGAVRVALRPATSSALLTPTPVATAGARGLVTNFLAWARAEAAARPAALVFDVKGGGEGETAAVSNVLPFARRGSGVVVESGAATKA